MAGNWKEPWEMTRAEYNQSVDKSLGMKVEDWAEQEEARMRTSGHPVSKEVLASGMRNHKEIVKQALVEGKPVPTEVLKDYPELKAKPEASAAVRDVTPKGFGLVEGGAIVSSRVQKRQGESLDDAIAREVGYQIDNDRVKLTEDRDGWKATVVGLTDEKPHVIRAYRKQQVLNEVWRYLNPDYVEHEVEPETDAVARRDKFLQEQAIRDNRALIEEEIKKAGNRIIGMRVAADRLGRQADPRTGMVDPEWLKAAKLIRAEAEKERAKAAPDHTVRAKKERTPRKRTTRKAKLSSGAMGGVRGLRR